MPIEKWSDSVSVAHLADDPQLTEDLESLDPAAPLTTDKNASRQRSAILDLAAVHFVNSSNIARLLKLRRQLLQCEGRLILCNVNNEVWSTFLITGLDKLFDFSENVPTALATVQMSAAQRDGK